MEQFESIWIRINLLAIGWHFDLERSTLFYGKNKVFCDTITMLATRDK